MMKAARSDQLDRRTLLTGAGAMGLALSGMAVLPSDAEAASPIRAFAPRGSGDMDHGPFDAVLKAHVKPDSAGYNRVDYRGLLANRTSLAAYLSTLEAARPSGFGKNAAHAYWINLYNAKTLDVVLDRYPVKSIKDINLGGGGLFGSGPWSAKLVKVEGVELSLDDIEHRIVRALFKDPLSHYALNCASYSCPNLMTRAFTASRLDAMLEENARAYVNHPRGISVDGKRAEASRIYSWYSDDFGGRDGVRNHWAQFAAPALAAALKDVSSVRYSYDWSLNDA